MGTLRCVGLLVLGTLFADLSDAGVNLNLVGASRETEESFGGELDRHVALGFTVDVGEDGWVVRPAVGLQLSVSSDDSQLDELLVRTAELTTGFIWYPRRPERGRVTPVVQPYVDGGLSLLRVELEDPNCFILACDYVDVDDDTALALYAGAGVVFRVGDRFHLGLDARWLTGGDVELTGVSYDSDYRQIGLSLAWLW